MSGWDRRVAALSGVTLPPYWMRMASATGPRNSGSRLRMKWCTVWACSGVAVSPVPMAHTGS
jgi:hypothetical protein